MSPSLTKINHIFGSEGPLAQSISGYAPRAVQLAMAQAVADALAKSQVLIAEAGTGTGKTYAYLIPSLLSGKKVIVSTGTKNLQDQLFLRDIPLLRRTLKLPFKVAILKGRSNYICRQRLHEHLQANLNSPWLLKTLYDIKLWADQSQDGEIEHIVGVKPDATILPYITSTPDNCLGQECEFFGQCFLFKARRLAQESDLIIINHHLFFADHHLKDAGISELLPDVDAIIFDEAHQLPEVATHFLGVTISARQLLYLVRDVLIEQETEASDMHELKQVAEQLRDAIKQLSAAIGTNMRGAWEHIVHKPALKQAVEATHVTLYKLQQFLETVAIRSKGLENCWRRTQDLFILFNRLTIDLPELQVHWYETQESNFTIHHTPLYIGHYFQRLIEEHKKTWIFTSATLSVAGNFEHFEYHLGQPAASTLYLESPFNYLKQSLLYLPHLQYQPNDENYLKEIVRQAIPIIKLTQGRAFFLFTSHKALREAAILLQQEIDYPLLIQGDASKTQLLDAFCSQNNAVLLGTSSFWEGVDVKGSRLSCVIIDKIPFMAPDDPILKARVDYFKKEGKNPFLEYQLPHSIIALRQGVGRLIRDVNDKGILMLCDPRLRTKDYGKLILNSLPYMSTTSSLEDVALFMEQDS
jgi:ATP-dependent DNA helicase DinG